MTAPRGDALEVWGDPIAHSRSPELHAAAYGVLGEPWSYGRRRVSTESFARELASLDARFRGLSLTFPLKGSAFDASMRRDRRAELTGAVNTLLLADEGPQGFNTDVGGLAAALREEGVGDLSTARIVGAGATATSALIALSELGARRVEVVARRPEAVAHLATLGNGLGVAVETLPFGERPASVVPVTIATLPGDAPLAAEVAAPLAETGGLLYDVVYGHWPTALGQAWASIGERAVNGLGMLLHQAVLQVRVFTTGRVDEPLPGEDAVLAAMRAAVASDAVAPAAAVGD